MRTHCCDAMGERLVVAPTGWVDAPDRPIAYDPVFDEYVLTTPLPAPTVPLAFCPWCGLELPGSKRDRWYDEVRRLGYRPDDPALPDHLRTDAWWAQGTDR